MGGPVPFGGLEQLRRAATRETFMNNRSQADRLSKEFQSATPEALIRGEGKHVILSARPADWSPDLDAGPVASKEFVDDVEDLLVQEREP